MLLMSNAEQPAASLKLVGLVIKTASCLMSAYTCFNVSPFQVNDICKVHIDDVIEEISETMLIELPDSASSLEDLVCLNKAWPSYFHFSN